MGNKGFTNRAKSGQKAMPSRLRRVKHTAETTGRLSSQSVRRQRETRDSRREGSGADESASPPVQVEAYAGSRAEESPRRFRIQSRTVEVIAVMDQWRGPEHAYFKVSGDDGATYVLRYDVTHDRWDLAEEHPVR